MKDNLMPDEVINSSTLRMNMKSVMDRMEKCNSTVIITRQRGKDFILMPFDKYKKMTGRKGEK